MRAIIKNRALALLALSIFLVISFSGFSHVHAAGDTVDEIKYSFGDTNDSVVFDWHGTETTIYYGLTTYYNQSAVASHPTITPFNGDGQYEEVALTGLATDTIYHYKIGVNGLDHTFQTVPTGSFNWVDIGDTMSTACDATSPKQDGSWMGPEQQLVANQSPNFVTHGGDMAVPNQCGLASLHQYFVDQQVWSTGAAFQPALGNHEYGAPLAGAPADAITDDNSNYKGRFFMTHAQTASNDGPKITSHPGCGADVGSKVNTCPGKDWGWFQAGRVLFISYPEPEQNNAWVDWQAQADKLMAQAQANPNIDFIVTWGHRPSYTSSTEGPNLSIRTATQALAAKYSPTASNPTGKYILNVQHHAHSMEAFAPISGLTYVTDAAGGQGLTSWVSPVDPNSIFRSMHFGLLSSHYDATARTMTISLVCGPTYQYEKDHCNYGDKLWTNTFTSANVQSQSQPALQLSYTDGATNVQPGQQLTYTAMLKNTGTATATATTVTATLPAGSQFISADDSVTPAADGTITWSMGDIGVGLSVSKQVTIQVGSQAIGSNVVSSAAAASSDTSCQQAISNCTATDTDGIPAPVLNTTLTDNTTTAQNGDTVTYNTSIQNTQVGTVAAGVTLTLTLPANVTITNANGGTVSGNTVSWPTADVAGGSSISGTVVGTVSGVGEGTSLVSAATAQSTDSSCQLPGNSCSATDTDVVPVPQLLTTLNDSVTTAKTGDTMHYNVTIQNTQADSTASGVTYSLTLPANLTIVDPAGGNVNGNTITWPSPNIASGQMTASLVTANVTSAVAGSNFTASLSVQASDLSCQNTASICSASDTDSVPQTAKQWIPNQSVETNLTGWASYNTDTTFTRVTTDAHDGSASIQMVRKDATAGAAGVITKPDAVSASVAGTTYDGTVWVRSQQAGQSVTLMLKEFDTAGNTVSSKSVVVTSADTNWHQLETTYTAQKSGDTVRFIVYASNLTATGWFHIDLMSLTSPQ